MVLQLGSVKFCTRMGFRTSCKNAYAFCTNRSFKM